MTFYEGILNEQNEDKQSYFYLNRKHYLYINIIKGTP